MLLDIWPNGGPTFLGRGLMNWPNERQEVTSMEANEMRYSEVEAAGRGFIEMICGHGTVRLLAGKSPQAVVDSGLPF